MKGCPIPSGKADIINTLLVLHKKNQEITLNRLFMELKSIRTDYIQLWLNDLEQKGFITFQYAKNLRKTIKVTDTLFVLNRLITLTNLLAYGKPEFYDYALPSLEKVIKYLKQRKKEGKYENNNKFD